MKIGSICKECNFKIRGANHENGNHHKLTKLLRSSRTGIRVKSDSSDTGKTPRKMK